MVCCMGRELLSGGSAIDASLLTADGWVGCQRVKPRYAAGVLGGWGDVESAINDRCFACVRHLS